MTDEVVEGQKMASPVLAQIMAHPTTGQLLVLLNDGITEDEQVGFCLGAAQTFIGLAAKFLTRPNPKKILVPDLRLGGPLR